MTMKAAKHLKDVLNTVADTQDPTVIKAAAIEVDALIKEEAARIRRPQVLPEVSQYAFKQGEQVALQSADGRVRTEYEYVERLAKFDVVMNMKTGAKHRVWLNKVLPMAVATRIVKEQAKAKAAAEKQQKKA